MSRDDRTLHLREQPDATSQVPLLLQQCHYAGLPEPVTEHRFHPERRWRFDVCWPEHKLAVEVEGGVYVAGRHSRGAGLEKDCEKYNTALIHGWRVIRASSGQVKRGEAVQWVCEAMGQAK